MIPLDVQRILHLIGLRPQQAAGQNFLLDENVVEAMVEAAGIAAGQKVLEIGPGLGILTRGLLNRGADVTAVELDTRLYAYLKKTLKGQSHLRLINKDIFKVRLDEMYKDGEYSVVANLPYSATSLVFRNFLTLSPRPSSMTVMVQHDVAKRMVAVPGEMSVLSLMVQYYAVPSLLFTVPSDSFYPAPKVTSAVLHCDVNMVRHPEEDAELFRFIRAGFSSRRKFLRNNLHNSLGLDNDDLTERFKKLGLDEKARAQELSLKNWLELATSIVASRF